MKPDNTSAKTTLLTAGLVRELYQHYLGREPESPTVVSDHLRSHRSRESFEQALAKSPEHVRHAAVVQAKRELLSLGSSKQNEIQVDVPEAVLEQLFVRTQNQWAALGETDPYWSVVSAPQFHKDSFAGNREEFFKSGQDAANLLNAFLQRNKLLPRRGTLIELGCGVGRVTVHLASMFERVVAVDISPGNLARCNAHLREAAADNVSTYLLRAPSQLSALPMCDFFYSVIVLQHNPPPVAAFCLKSLLRKVKPGGVALFQVPTHTPGYAFNAAGYLASSEPANGMEMHCLPMDQVYQLLFDCGFQMRETLADAWTGWPGSHTFLATRR